jgi:hypothetical protein
MNWYKTAKKTVSPKEMASLRKLVHKIMMGNRNWTDEELQLQQNFPDVLEEMLQAKI